MKYLSKSTLYMPAGSQASEDTWERCFGKKSVDCVASEGCKASTEVWMAGIPIKELTVEDLKNGNA